MSVTKPIAKPMVAFDATQPQDFLFSSSGGDLVVKNRLTIRKQSDNTVVYQESTETYLFKHTVPANTLQNNTYYNFYFNTYNVDDEMSANSNVLQFYCFSAPTLEITNIPQSGIISSTNFTFEAEYDQTEGELLDSVKFVLYDSLGVKITESQLYYGTDVLPTVIEHTINGLDNNGTYFIQLEGTTQYGTLIESEVYTFNIDNYHSTLYSVLNLENDCNRGCIRLSSNLIMINGTVTGSPEYVHWGTDNYMIDLVESNQSVTWNEGFEITSNFTMKTMFEFRDLGKFLTLSNSDGTSYYTLSVVREIPYGQSNVKDCIELRGYRNNELAVLQKSNYVDIMNKHSHMNLWWRKVENTYTLTIEYLESEATNFAWGESNMGYNDLTTLQFVGSSYDQADAPNPLANPMVTLMNKIEICNGAFDVLEFTTDVTEEYNTDEPTWTYGTRMLCNFNQDVYAGNVTSLLNTLQYIKIKRRQTGTFQWITLKKIKIDSVADLAIYYDDYFVPCGYDADYAIVPTLDNDIEGDYITNSVHSAFRYAVITDGMNAYPMQNIQYGSMTDNIIVGQYNPMSGLYPIINRNSQLQYKSGSFTAMMLGYHFAMGKQLDRQDIYRQSEDFTAFINDVSKGKILKDTNGRILVIRTLGNPSSSFNGNWGNGLISVSVNWVEQGKFDNQSDLINTGLIDEVDN